MSQRKIAIACCSYGIVTGIYFLIAQSFPLGLGRLYAPSIPLLFIHCFVIWLISLNTLDFNFRWKPLISPTRKMAVIGKAVLAAAILNFLCMRWLAKTKGHLPSPNVDDVTRGFYLSLMANSVMLFGSVFIALFFAFGTEPLIPKVLRDFLQSPLSGLFRSFKRIYRKTRKNLG